MIFTLSAPSHWCKARMKILVIMGSPRNGNTYHAAERIRETLQEKAPVEWEYVMLRNLHLEQCRGCGSCFVRGEDVCPIDDDVGSVVAKMQDADGVIFATPVYALQVSGLMKVFIDRLSYILHRPRFFRQKALILTTAGAVGTSDVLTYLDQIARVMGFDVAAKVGILAEFLPESRKKENERKLQAAAEEFLAALRKGSRPSPGFSDVLLFHGQRATFDELADQFPTDHAYWSDQGWLEPGCRYFVDVPVNPISHAAGTLLEWYQRRQIRKDLRDMV